MRPHARRANPHHCAQTRMNRPLLTFMVRRGRRFESVRGLRRKPCKMDLWCCLLLARPTCAGTRRVHTPGTDGHSRVTRHTLRRAADRTVWIPPRKSLQTRMWCCLAWRDPDTAPGQQLARALGARRGRTRARRHRRQELGPPTGQGDPRGPQRDRAGTAPLRPTARRQRRQCIVRGHNRRRDRQLLRLTRDLRPDDERQRFIVVMSHRRRGGGRRFRGRRHTGADRSGLAARTGRRHRPDSRHQTRLPRRGEHRSRRSQAEPGAERAPGRPPASATTRRTCPPSTASDLTVCVREPPRAKGTGLQQPGSS
jgi:hypothetical protein